MALITPPRNYLPSAKIKLERFLNGNAKGKFDLRFVEMMKLLIMRSFNFSSNYFRLSLLLFQEKKYDDDDFLLYKRSVNLKHSSSGHIL